MHEVDYLRTLASLIVVLGAIGLGFWLLKRFDLARFMGARQANKAMTTRRLDIVETRMIDPKTKLLLLRCDGTEHLVLHGAGGSTLIDSRIAGPSH